MINAKDPKIITIFRRMLLMLRNKGVGKNIPKRTRTPEKTAINNVGIDFIKYQQVLKDW
jgi:hypothetical protein